MLRLIYYAAVVVGFRILYRQTVNPKLQAERLSSGYDPLWILVGLPSFAASLVVSLLTSHPAGSWGFILLVLGGILNWWATVSNPYFIPTIRVTEGQRPVANGPYAVIRHPGYLGFAAMLLSLPICIGSYWGLIPLIAVLWFFYQRIQKEESYLRSNLVGYEEYTRMVHWRIFPGVW